MHFLDPTNDYAFKKIFGDEKKKHILISFLNSILQLQGDRHITEVTLMNPFQAPHIKDAKGTILDVRCQDQRGEEYVVEMQVLYEPFFDKRVTYYASKAYAGQLSKGQRYPRLKPVIFLGILNFEFNPSNPNPTSTHLIQDVETQDHLLKDFRFTFAELPKFKKTEEELTTVEDKWLYFLKHAKELTTVPSVIHESAIKEAFEVMERENWDKQNLDAYEYREIEVQKRSAQMHYNYDRGKLEGRKEGEQIGLDKGKKEGEQIGLDKGKKEGEQIGLDKGKKEVAMNLLAEGYAVEKVAQLTGLSLKEVRLLQAS